MTIMQRSSEEVMKKEINRETDLHIYTDMFNVLNSMSPAIAFEKGVAKYFTTGHNPEYGQMYMDFEVEALCDEARKVAQPFIQKVADFFEVEETFIDTLSFEFI